MAFKEQKKIPVLHVCDFETGGLNSTEHGVTQWTVQLIRCDDWSTIAVYNEYVKPYSKVTKAKPSSKKKLKSKFEDDEKPIVIPMEYTDKSLQITGITLEKLDEEGLEIEDAVEKYIRFLEENKIDGGAKPIMVGQNITFDIDFWYAFIGNVEDGLKRVSKLIQGTKFKSAGDVFVPKYIDTLPMSKVALYEDLDDFSLESLCAKAGMEVETAHNALYDVEATANLAKTYLMRIKNSLSAIEYEEKEKTRKHFAI